MNKDIYNNIGFTINTEYCLLFVLMHIKSIPQANLKVLYFCCYQYYTYCTGLHEKNSSLILRERINK